MNTTTTRLATKPEVTSIAASSARVAYSDRGAGEPVLMLHCTSASSTEWRSLCDLLGEEFRPIATDQLGCGRSDPWPGQRPFTLAEEAAPILRIIDGIGHPVHLVGHSYGGGLALRIARERPEMVRSLTLVEPSCFHLLRQAGGHEQSLFREITEIADVVRNAVTTGNYGYGMERFVDYWSGKGTWSRMDGEAQTSMSRKLGKVALDFHALTDEPACLEDYAALDHPTLILCGERALAPSRRIVELLADVLPNAVVEEIAGAGHLSPFTHAEAVNEAIHRHIHRTGNPALHHAKAA